MIRAVGDNTGGTKMLWVLDALRDLLIQGLAEPGEFSIKNLTGKGIGNKGTVHVLMVKQQCMDYVTDELAEEMRLDVDTRARLRQMRAGGHDCARRDYIGGPVTKADKTWIGFLPPSGQLVIRFVSENVYGLTNDWAWKAAVNGGKSAKDAMEQSPFQSMIAETKTLREGELGIQAPGDGDGDKNEQQLTVQAAAGCVEELMEAAKDTQHEDDIGKWKSYAEELYNETVTLLVEPESQAQLTTLIQESGIGKTARGVRSDKKELSYVMDHFDVSLSGECITEPWLNSRPLKKPVCQKLMKAAMEARADPDDSEAGIREGDLWTLLDGRKGGTQTQNTLLSSFTDEDGKNVAKHVHTIFIITEEGSLMKRRTRVRGSTTLDQMEKMMLVTRDIYEVVDKPRKHFGGTSRGNAIGPVSIVDFDGDPKECWKLPRDDKTKLYGERRQPIGGNSNKATGDNVDHESGGGQQLKRQRVMEVDQLVAFHSKSVAFYEELIHCSSIRAVIDLTPGCDLLATACLWQRVPYLGVTYSDTHKEPGR